jgi:hypothetical protein
MIDENKIESQEGMAWSLSTRLFDNTHRWVIFFGGGVILPFIPACGRQEGIARFQGGRYGGKGNNSRRVSVSSAGIKKLRLTPYWRPVGQVGDGEG